MLSLLARESSSSEPGDKTEGRKILRKLYEWEGSHIVKAEVSKHRPYVAEIPPKERVSGIYGISQLFDTEKISFVSTHPHSTYIGKRGDFCVETKENSMQTKEASS